MPTYTTERGEPRPASFRELKEQDVVTSPELLETMADYANGGWAISGLVAWHIAERTQLSQEDFQQLHDLALAGVDAQEQRLRHGVQSEPTTRREQEEYLLVARYAAWNLRDSEAEATAQQKVRAMFRWLSARIR